MVVKEIQTVTEEEFIRYIGEAAQAANYQQQGFGITGCDLLLMVWWAAYCRQSLDQQAQNNRLPEYLLSLAKMARDQGVVVPREYVFYDHVTGEHLDRPGMQFLRHELVGKKKVLGIFFSDLRCLSREPAPPSLSATSWPGWRPTAMQGVVTSAVSSRAGRLHTGLPTAIYTGGMPR